MKRRWLTIGMLDKETEKTELKGRISLLMILEIIILAIGVAISTGSTVKPLKYTTKYVWCFIFFRSWE